MWRRRAASVAAVGPGPVGRASRALGEDYLLELPVAPEALAGRLSAAINKRPRRAFGVVKVHSEWVGLVAGNEFVVWEKQQHATRAQGRIRGVRGGSRVEARITLTRRALILTVVFFALFAVGALGLLGREGGLGLGPAGLAMATLGALVTLAIFWAAALGQRAALRRFLDGVFTGPQP